jgi:glycosyltransferase involved in cell wall biosynthesis
MARALLAPGPIRRELELERLAALHFPLSVMLPEVDRPPAATTIHDVAHELVPRAFSPAERAYRRVVYARTARRSRLVIAVSEHVRDTLVERLGLAPDAVRVIPHGVDRDRFRPGEKRRERFLLYPANGWAHKNHRRLVAAFALVRNKQPDLRLVLTGSGLERLPHAAGVEVRGRVDESELVHLLQTASLLVIPSLYEGFGLPALEAMACGCPVAAACAGALPETCGDAAVYFDPMSPEAIAAGILEGLAHADELRARGLARAASFSWDASARAHEAVYRELAGG